MRRRMTFRAWRWPRRATRLALGALVVGASISLVGAIIGALLLWSAAWWFPLPEELRASREDTLTLLDRHGREIATIGSKRARAADALTLAEMGEWLPRVAVALEDRRFWSHGGVDLHALAGTAWRNVASFRIVSGGSTVEQQLIKNARGRSGGRWWNKLREALAARRLARDWPKARILEEYLNRIDYGNRRLGPHAAARAYFGKEPADLSVAEAVFLSGLPQAPTRYNPWLRPEQAAERYRRSVRVLHARGVLDAATARELAAAPPPVQRAIPPNAAPHFVDALTARAPHLRGRVATTLDLELQREVAGLARDHVRRLEGRGVGQAAVVVIDNRDGSVRALVGSVDYAARDGQLDGALLPRSAGSTLKPFLYAHAIDQRIFTAASILPDTPDAIHAAYVDYDPQNFDQRFLGPVRLREALGSSLNVPAVYALSRVGARPFFAHLGAWGFRFPRDLPAYGAGLILGNAEPRLLDLAAAFAGFASAGRVPVVRWLETDSRESRRVISPEAAAIITDILCDDDARRRAFGRDSALALTERVPCKTGTSSGFRDAWTVGSTADHTVAVWAGNFDGQPMAAASSIEAAAPLWRAVTELLLRTDTGVPAPEPMDQLVARDICRLTGFAPAPQGPGTLREWFLAGTEPTRSADEWLRREIADDSRTTLVLPEDYAVWCRSPHNFLGATVAPPRSIRIRSPAANATYALDPHLPLAQQMLPLAASLPPNAEPVWSVDGQAVAVVGGMPLWPLAAGAHVAEVRAGEHSARVHFTVKP